MQTTGPYTLTLGSATTIPAPSAVTTYKAVALANLSPYACQISGHGGPSQWLQPFSADLFAFGDSITVTPALTTIPGPANSPQVLASWYTEADNIPGNYPVSLTAQAVLAANQFNATTLVSGQVVNGGVSGASFTISGLTQTTRYLTVYWTSTSLIDTSAIITGNTTGIIYDTVVAALETFGPITNPQGGHFDLYVENTLDTAVTVTLPQLTAGKAITFWVVGAPLSPLTHIDDGQILPVYNYPAGGADTPFSLILTVAAQVLIPAPSTGQLYQVNGFTVYSFGAAGNYQITVKGQSSGNTYATWLTNTSGNAGYFPSVIFTCNTSEPLQALTSAVPAGGNIELSGVYRTLAAV